MYATGAGALRHIRARFQVRAVACDVKTSMRCRSHFCSRRAAAGMHVDVIWGMERGAARNLVATIEVCERHANLGWMGSAAPRLLEGTRVYCSHKPIPLDQDKRSCGRRAPPSTDASRANRPIACGFQRAGVCQYAGRIAVHGRFEAIERGRTYE